jgi:hypothetical protein
VVSHDDGVDGENNDISGAAAMVLAVTVTVDLFVVVLRRSNNQSRQKERDATVVEPFVK